MEDDRFNSAFNAFKKFYKDINLPQIVCKKGKLQTHCVDNQPPIKQKSRVHYYKEHAEAFEGYNQDERIPTVGKLIFPYNG